MKTFAALVLVFSALTVGAFEDHVATDFDHDAMKKAIAKAKSRLDEFIKIFKEGKFEHYGVKILVNDGDQHEYFWVDQLKLAEDGNFTGVIGNDAELVKNVKLGQKVTVKKEAIEDWTYMKGKTIYGNFTLRVLMKTMDKKELEGFLKEYNLADE